MICICELKILIFMALTLCIDFVSTSSKECSITENKGVYYSTNASKSYGKLLKTFEAKNKEECKRSCCDLQRCNFLMYSTVLRDEERSTNKTCFLFNCTETFKCKTRKVPSNISGESVIGIKQENFTEGSLNYTVEQHKIYKPPSNSTEHVSETQAPINITMQNTKNIVNFNKTDRSSITSANISLQSETLQLSTYVPSSTSNTSYPLVSLSSQKIAFINNSHLTSRIIPSKTIAISTKLNHSSTPSYPITSIHDTNQSRLSMLTHSTPLRTHTLGYQPRSNGSSRHVAQLAGSYSNVDSGSQSSHYQSHTPLKTLDSLSTMSINSETWLNSLRSKPDTKVVTTFVSTPSTFVYLPFYKTEALSLSTMSSHYSDRSYVLGSNTSHISHGSHKTRKSHSKQQIHTTRVSLVISLIIGILLFGTVVFLIGRRWSEQCFRRGYSRVDYLLNDYD